MTVFVLGFEYCLALQDGQISDPPREARLHGPTHSPLYFCRASYAPACVSCSRRPCGHYSHFSLPPPGGRGVQHVGAPPQREALLARPGDPAHTAQTHWANPADTGSCDLDGGELPRVPPLLRAILQYPVAHTSACSAVDTIQCAL